MEIQNLTDDVILVKVHREPEMGGELQTVCDIVNDRGDCDIILNFSEVDIITSPSLAKLLKLRKTLEEQGHQLIFCSVQEFTKHAFEVTGLDGIFQLAADETVASELVGHSS